MSNISSDITDKNSKLKISGKIGHKTNEKKKNIIDTSISKKNNIINSSNNLIHNTSVDFYDNSNIHLNQEKNILNVNNLKKSISFRNSYSLSSSKILSLN
jgi:hypothetical protein